MYNNLKLKFLGLFNFDVFMPKCYNKLLELKKTIPTVIVLSIEIHLKVLEFMKLYL